jgi:alkanesulfonate monooxygenase SsuD/methylene tetrahydromethanopterin reductase-like flavin-dependent oxidoreductase (luciferase family)
VHDISELERRGLPGVFVTTVQFEDAADAQAAALGLDVAKVMTAHPIQDRTDDEMRALADTVLDQLVDALVGPT